MSSVLDAEAPHRLRMRTSDVDEARDEVARTFAEHDMTIRGGRQLDFNLDLAVAPRLIIGRMSYGVDTMIDAPAMRSCYHVNLPLAGLSTVVQNGVRKDSRAGEAGVAFLPTAPLSINWKPNSDQYVIKLRKEQLEAHAAKLIGQRTTEGIQFDLTFGLQSGAAQALVATAGFIYAELIRPDGVSTIPAARHELEALVMTQLLMVVPNQFSSLLHGRPAPTRRSKIIEIIELIDLSPSSDLTTVELAAKAGVSARALQAGFQEVVGMSPMAYLRGARLDRVHHELLAGTGESVTDVAGRWGFFHPGRFADQYRARFGDLPSRTARRLRNGPGQSGDRLTARRSAATQH